MQQIPDRVTKAADGCLGMLPAMFEEPALDQACLKLFGVSVSAYRKHTTPHHILLHALDHDGENDAGPSASEASHEYLLIDEVPVRGEVKRVFASALPSQMVCYWNMLRDQSHGHVATLPASVAACNRQTSVALARAKVPLARAVPFAVSAREAGTCTCRTLQCATITQCIFRQTL